MKPDRIKEIEGLIERLASEGENALRKNLSMGMHGLCAEAASALVELIEERKWRTIESAPKDGTVIDLWVRVEETSTEKRIPDCKWGLMGTWSGEQVEGWIGLGHMHENRIPLAWLPLPSPPEEGEGK